MSLKVVSVWNPKGGQGKSLVALNLAAAAIDLDMKPLIIDGDRQGTCVQFQKEGNIPFDVLPEIPRSAPDADLVIIDHQANDWEVPPAPVVVMPVKPDRSQVITYLEALAIAKNAGKRIVPIVTHGDLRRKDEAKVVRGLQKSGAFFIPSSVVFGKASGEMRTVFDDRLNNTYGVKDRRNEFRSILAAVLQQSDTTNMEAATNAA